jgi:hypothetical protein
VDYIARLRKYIARLFKYIDVLPKYSVDNYRSNFKNLSTCVDNPLSEGMKSESSTLLRLCALAAFLTHSYFGVA